MIQTMVQGTPEWHEQRKRMIGGSDAPIIMGKSPWKTPYQLWLYKMGIAPEEEPTEQMKLGTENEPIARLAFEEQTGILVEPQVVFSEKYPWMIASLDGMDGSMKNIVEIKCCGKADHELAEKGEVPEKYKWQLIHQMIACELEECFYFSFHKGEGICVKYKLEQEPVDQLLDKEREFFRCMEEFEPPMMSDRDFIERNDEEWLEKSRHWLSVHRQVQELNSLEAALRKDLIALAGKSSSRGAGIRLSKTFRRGTIDYKEIEKDLGISLDKYRKAGSESWRLSDAGTA